MKRKEKFKPMTTVFLSDKEKTIIFIFDSNNSEKT